MKNVEQVDKAAALACRFANVDWRTADLTQEGVLKQVLSETELKVYGILSDKEKGPFAELHEGQSSSETKSPPVPLYQWDGVAEAHKFWQGVDGAKYEDWQLKTL
ncbi:MAG: hypothetical protein SGARI_003170 [Bacillariaceae sp.]